jgi:hypothetical protein
MCVGRWIWLPAGALRARLAMCGALGRASVNSGAANQRSPTMSTPSIKSRNTKSAAPKKGSAQSNTASRRKVTSPAANAKKPTRSVESNAERVAAAKTLRKADEPRAEGVTKQERVLTLLSQSEGASIEEMMQATGWQQHSVRGFLAGTVKRKLGFPLTSVKPNGALADMDKAAIDIAQALVRLSEVTIFELRGEWRRLHRMPPPMRFSRDLLTRGITYKASGAGVRRPL